MLHILLLILKILLWILLGILGFVLLIVLIVLFAPIHYKAGLKYDGKAFVKAKVRFLFVSLGVEFSQEEKKLSKAICIAGIRLGGGKNKTKSEEISEVETAEKSDVDKDEYTEHDAGNISTDEMQKKDEIKSESDAEINEDFRYAALNTETFTDEFIEDEKKKTEKASDESTVDVELGNKPSLADKIKSVAAKAKNIWLKLSPEYIMDAIDKKSDEISTKYNKLEKTANRYIKLWNLKCTVKTRNYLKGYLLSLVRHIGPGKIKGYVRYGFGDPAKTGQITGYISLLPFVYQKNFSLQPDFYDKVIEADVDIKGHLMLGYILRIALKPYLWRTIKVARKVVAQNK